MNSLKHILRSTSLVLGAVLASVCCTASSAVLLDNVLSLNAGDATTLGRLTRNGVPSDWSTLKAFPGVTSPTVSFHYRTITIPAATIGLARFVQISVDDPQLAIFTSAYDNAFVPNPAAANRGLDVNLIGDNGSSGLQFTNMISSQAIVPAGHDLVVLISDVSTTGVGLNKNFRLLVEGFSDTAYTDPFAGPRITRISKAGNNIVLDAVDGLGAQNYTLLTAPSPLIPRAQWTPIASNTLAASGNFTLIATNSATTSTNRFFSIRLN